MEIIKYTLGFVLFIMCSAFVSDAAYLHDGIDPIYGELLEAISDKMGVDPEIEVGKGYLDRRGKASQYKVWIDMKNIDDMLEFLHISIHEVAHVLNYQKGRKEYWNISRSKERVHKYEHKYSQFCTLYGMYDKYEDFAECITLYTMHYELFKYRASKNKTLKKKFDFIEKNLGRHLRKGKLNMNKDLIYHDCSVLTDDL